MGLKITFVDPNEIICEELRKCFLSNDSVNVVTGIFSDVKKYDCIVSPGNSFGLMDGGIDYYIVDYFGKIVMENVQKRILSDFRGEQPCGTSIIVETGNINHPWIAHTPTMRIPSKIFDGDVYRSMWSMLLAVWNFNKVESRINEILCSGLGTGYGQVKPEIAAHEMYAAWNNFHNPPNNLTWDHALSIEESVKKR